MFKVERLQCDELNGTYWYDTIGMISNEDNLGDLRKMKRKVQWTKSLPTNELPIYRITPIFELDIDMELKTVKRLYPDEYNEMFKEG